MRAAALEIIEFSRLRRKGTVERKLNISPNEIRGRERDKRETGTHATFQFCTTRNEDNMELVDDYNADEMGELIPKAAAAASVAQSVDLIMPKQFAVQTRTIILNMLVRDGMNDEFICIYNSFQIHIITQLRSSV